ncbi:hypothetical protein L228DRAFT_282428 [Xylona heveae TC161]|uniref:Phospholipid/glycerol acyltransferase domain-containing protein n=1 Tax=Xylona heveae (strain CBS 132557 / TC161) TaxID=1328760 RepID=A0A165HMJ5_XYLHT|nr:hypothetical protein L228DRAFT_282428 [Xylona heveae TC161]KZF23738.1 hypothetical protein L228DRAFT_282428 [Xylona heveae TC161]
MRDSPPQISDVLTSLRRSSSPRASRIIYTIYTTLRGTVILTPWIIYLGATNILLSLLLPFSFLFPTAVYDISSLLAWSVWAGIQAIFTKINGAEITFSYSYKNTSPAAGTAAAASADTGNRKIHKVHGIGKSSGIDISPSIDTETTTSRKQNGAPTALNNAFIQEDVGKQRDGAIAANKISTNNINDILPQHESAIVIANHVSWTDFYMIQALASQAGMLSRCRWFAKKQLRWVPFLGWGLWAMRMPLVSRKWMVDRREMERVFAGVAEHKWPLWLISFSESTRYTPAKYAATAEWCRSHHRPVPQHTLYPRTKGFVATVQQLRRSAPHVKAVYDLTLAYASLSSSSSPSESLSESPSSTPSASPYSSSSSSTADPHSSSSSPGPSSSTPSTSSSSSSSSPSSVSTFPSRSADTADTAGEGGGDGGTKPSVAPVTPITPVAAAPAPSFASEVPAAAREAGGKARSGSGGSDAPLSSPPQPPPPTTKTTTTKTPHFMNAPSIYQTLFHPHLRHTWRFHIHVERHELAALPDTDAGLAEWLEGQWIRKGQKLEELRRGLERGEKWGERWGREL